MIYALDNDHYPGQGGGGIKMGGRFMVDKFTQGIIHYFAAGH